MRILNERFNTLNNNANEISIKDLLIGCNMVALNNCVLIAQKENNQIVIGINDNKRIMDCDIDQIINDWQVNNAQVISDINIESNAFFVAITLKDNDDIIAQWNTNHLQDYAIVRNIENNREDIVKAIY